MTSQNKTSPRTNIPRQLAKYFFLRLKPLLATLERKPPPCETKVNKSTSLFRKLCPGVGCLDAQCADCCRVASATATHTP